MLHDAPENPTRNPAKRRRRTAYVSKRQVPTPKLPSPTRTCVLIMKSGQRGKAYQHIPWQSPIICVESPPSLVKHSMMTECSGAASRIEKSLGCQKLLY